MKEFKTCVNDCLVYRLDRHYDERGYFEEICLHFFMEIRQVNVSSSKKNVLRGIHVSNFAKMVRCIKGKIFDVIVDVRKDSSTRLKWHGQILTEESALSVYVPAGCGHGFLALEDSIVCYSQDGYYDPMNEYIISYADPTLNICWPGTDFIISEKDLNAGF